MKDSERMRRTKALHAGSGFLSQHSKEMLFGLGASTRVSALTVEWPSGRRDVFKDVPLEHRVRIEEGRALQAEAYTPIPPLAADETPPRPGPSPLRSWLFEPFPVPDLALRDLQGDDRSLSRLRGRPAVVLVFSAAVAESRQALVALARGAADLAGAGVGAVAISLDGSAALEQVRSVAASFTGPLPVCLAGDDVVLALAILHRHLFMSRPALPLPTTLLLDRQGQVVRVYRDLVDAAAILEDTSRMDAAPPERLARALPFTGVLGSAPSRRDYVPYGRELLDQGLDAAAASAFEQAALGSPTASVLYRLGGLLAKDGQSGKARAAYERALALQPDLSEASNDLGTLLAESGDLPAAIERFREPSIPHPITPTPSTTWATPSCSRAAGRRRRNSTRRP
jgi:tetratricopeptide (TPR) repeat protein